MAVTTTKVSLVTKLRMHRSFFALWPECAGSSNFNACEKETSKANTLRTVTKLKKDFIVALADTSSARDEVDEEQKEPVHGYESL